MVRPFTWGAGMPSRRTIVIGLVAAFVGGGVTALVMGWKARAEAREAHALRGEISLLIEARDSLLKQLSGGKEELDRAVASLSKAEIELQAAKRANIDLADKLTGYSEERARKQSEALRLTATQQLLQDQLRTQLADPRVGISRVGSSLCLNLEGSVLFESGQASLSSEGIEVMRRVSEVIKLAPSKAIRVIGHTDNRAVSQTRRGPHPTNWELSAARAVAVARAFQAAGLDPGRLSAAGYGEHRPAAGNGTPEERARNRRVEILMEWRR